MPTVRPPQPGTREIDAILGMFNERRYSEILPIARAMTNSFPQFGFGWKALGAVLRKMGRSEDALEALANAAALLPEDAEAHNNLGNVLTTLGRIEEAKGAYREALRIRPEYPEALNNLGSTLNDLGHREAAKNSYLEALRIRPEYPEALNNLANVLNELGRAVEAVDSYRAALRIRPEYPEALNNLGNILARLGRMEEAQESYREALRIRPDYPEAHNNLGNVLTRLGRMGEAQDSYREALRIRPDYPEAHNNLGNALTGLDRMKEAADSYREALIRRPDYVEAHNNLGNILKELGRVTEAEAQYRAALRIKPNDADATFNLGCLLIQCGKFEEGWECYEARYDPAREEHASSPIDVTFPQWRGQSLDGKTLLVWPEQGLGDQIMFCRFLQIVKAQGAKRITLVCSGPLKSLFETLAGADAVLTEAEARNIPPHDYWTFLLSIPLYCNPLPAGIPKTFPYLHADTMRQREMAGQLANFTEMKVGVCWRGSLKFKGDAERSPGLEPFAKLFGLAGVRFFALQAGGREEFLAFAGPAAFDLGHEIDALTPPFVETAALIMNLDLVITCDTSIGHLAGAMGQAVWIVLPFSAHWIWMLGREDSPWYPKTHLFRQRQRGHWDELFDQVAKRLKSAIVDETRTLWSADETLRGNGPLSAHEQLIYTPISVGELLDKITILEIKMQRITDETKRENVGKELLALKAVADASCKLDAVGLGIVEELGKVNRLLWDIEDGIRKCEKAKDFGEHFVELARSVYRYNDQRALLKKELNTMMGSGLIEEKSYAAYV